MGEKDTKNLMGQKKNCERDKGMKGFRLGEEKARDGVGETRGGSKGRL